MTEHDLAGTGCRVVRRRHQDLELVTVRNDSVTLTFLPQVGGRLLSCRFAGRELLWHNPELFGADLTPTRPLSSWPTVDATMASWANPGGNKTWPAPQGWRFADEWHGPPDPVLDSGPYRLDHTIDHTGAAEIELVSAPDDVTGVQITRRFHLPARGPVFEQVSSFRNRAPRPVRWAVWDVTQVDTAAERGAAGVVRVESIDEPGAVQHLFELDGVATYDRGPRHWTVPSQDVVGKIGFPGATGTLEWRRHDGVGLTLSTTRTAGEYPDGGCPVELWLQHPLSEALPELGGLRIAAHLIELEVLSPVETISPDATLELSTTWALSAGTDPTR